MHNDRFRAVMVPSMTSPQTASGTFTQAQLGTITLIGWSGAHPADGQDVAFLLAYSLGDGSDGPAAGEAAMRVALERAGLPVGSAPVYASEHPGLPVKLLVQAGQAVLTLPHFTAQYPARPEWLAAAGRAERGARDVRHPPVAPGNAGPTGERGAAAVLRGRP